jgi:glycosyltransferase involved in cell wall biosynthesis
MKLKIVEVSGPDSSIQYPIFKDGGRERVIEWISKELGKSQKVTVIAQNGSQIANCEILGVPHTTGLEPTEFFDTFRNNYDVLECDILHIHHPKYLLFSEYIKAKNIVLTHHGLYKEMEYYRHNYTFTETYVSHYLRSIMDIDSSGFTIHNPIPTNEYPLLNNDKEFDLLFIGDCNKKVKRLDIAISVAEIANIKLLVAGKAENDLIRQLDTLSFVTYIGEVNQTTKLDLMSKSKAVICPNDAPEAFCLVAAESNAIGTPVLSSNNGGLPEVIEHGFSGFICNTLEDYTHYFGQLNTLSSDNIRKVVLSKFDISLISQNYLNLFHNLLVEVK